MMAMNHAMTGVLIGLAVHQPAAALPLAFLSHFLLDAVPHYDPVMGTKAEIIGSKKFFREQVVVNGLLCATLVGLFALLRPEHWIVISICAFLGASLDAFQFPRFVWVKRTGKDLPKKNWLQKIHSRVQWRTGPKLLWVELLWLVITGALVAAQL